VVVGTHFGRHRDAEIYTSLPGLAVVLGARVLGEFGDDPHRYADAKARKAYAGTAPITGASGKKVILARYARNDRLADTVQQWAFGSMRGSPVPRRTTRPYGTGRSTTRQRCASSATGGSASSTAVSRPASSTTRTPLGATTTAPLLDKTRLGMSTAPKRHRK